MVKIEWDGNGHLDVDADGQEVQLHILPREGCKAVDAKRGTPFTVHLDVDDWRAVTMAIAQRNGPLFGRLPEGGGDMQGRLLAEVCRQWLEFTDLATGSVLYDKRPGDRDGIDAFVARIHREIEAALTWAGDAADDDDDDARAESNAEVVAWSGKARAGVLHLADMIRKEQAESVRLTNLLRDARAEVARLKAAKKPA